MCVLSQLLLIIAAPMGGGSSAISLLLPLLMIAVLYFLMIRPQQRKQKQWNEMLAKLKTGDKVTTTGGIRGVILSLKDDSLVLRVAPDGLKLEIAKSAIAAVTTQEDAEK